MKPSRHQRRLVLFAFACAVALQSSPGLAASGPGDEGRGVQVVFTKWVTDAPNMAGLVSGDVGGGTFAGEVLNYTPGAAIDRNYQVIYPCGIINAQNGSADDVCFQGTLDIGTVPKD